MSFFFFFGPHLSKEKHSFKKKRCSLGMLMLFPRWTRPIGRPNFVRFQGKKYANRGFCRKATNDVVILSLELRVFEEKGHL